MKPVLKNILVPFASAVTGGLLVVGGLKLSPWLQAKVLESPAKQELAVQSWLDPFEEIRNMHQQMEKEFENIRGSSVYHISEREDQDYVYYDIKAEDLSFTNLNTKVESGYVTITGTLEKNESSGQSFFKTTFNRSFPLPENIDQDKMQMTSEKGVVVLKFPKINS